MENTTPIRELLGLDLDADLLAAVRDLHDAAYTDALTGLPNRRALERELARPERRERTITVIDLDGFKAVNDNHGHAAGDAILQHAARQLRAQLRAGDFLARTGGDEFVIITRASEAPALRARLRLRGLPTVGISAGSAASLEEADRRMYSRKRRAA